MTYRLYNSYDDDGQLSSPGQVRRLGFLSDQLSQCASFPLPHPWCLLRPTYNSQNIHLSLDMHSWSQYYRSFVPKWHQHWIDRLLHSGSCEVIWVSRHCQYGRIRYLGVSCHYTQAVHGRLRIWLQLERATEGAFQRAGSGSCIKSGYPERPAVLHVSFISLIIFYQG